MLLGSHIPTVGGITRAIDRALGIGCSVMQIFVKNNMQWFAKPLMEEEIACFKKHPGREKLEMIVAHAGYLINLGVEKSENHQKSLRSLGEELMRCDQLEIPYLVLHPGSHLGAGIDHGLCCVIESLNTIHATYPKIKTHIALETTAGQGSSLGARFEELAQILLKVQSPERLAVCLDTAHVFAAGYDISKEHGIEKVMKHFEEVLGLNQLALLHLNESKTALGSHVDRHANLGDQEHGKIGIETFRWIINAPEFQKIPKILETPKGKDLKEDILAIELLKSFLIS